MKVLRVIKVNGYNYLTKVCKFSCLSLKNIKIQKFSNEIFRALYENNIYRVFLNESILKRSPQKRCRLF